MTISRGQMNRQLREGGGIASLSKEGIGGGDYRGDCYCMEQVLVCLKKYLEV